MASCSAYPPAYISRPLPPRYQSQGGDQLKATRTDCLERGQEMMAQPRAKSYIVHRVSTLSVLSISLAVFHPCYLLHALLTNLYRLRVLGLGVWCQNRCGYALEPWPDRFGRAPMPWRLADGSRSCGFRRGAVPGGSGVRRTRLWMMPHWYGHHRAPSPGRGESANWAGSSPSLTVAPAPAVVGEPEGVREKKSVAAHQTRRVLAWVRASLLRDYQSRAVDSQRVAGHGQNSSLEPIPCRGKHLTVDGSPRATIHWYVRPCQIPMLLASFSI